MKKAPLRFYVYSSLPFVAVWLGLWANVASSAPIFLACVACLIAGMLAISLLPDSITITLDGIFYKDDEGEK